MVSLYCQTSGQYCSVYIFKFSLQSCFGGVSQSCFGVNECLWFHKLSRKEMGLSLCWVPVSSLF